MVQPVHILQTSRKSIHQLQWRPTTDSRHPNRASIRFSGVQQQTAGTFSLPSHPRHHKSCTEINVDLRLQATAWLEGKGEGACPPRLANAPPVQTCMACA